MISEEEETYKKIIVEDIAEAFSEEFERIRRENPFSK